MSIMLNIFFIILLSCSLSTNVFAAIKTAVTSPKSTTSQEKIITGRYQLFQVKYRSTIVDTNAPVKEELVDGLFLLDTATGDLFLCESLYVVSRDSSDSAKNLIREKKCSPFKQDAKPLIINC